MVVKSSDKVVSSKSEEISIVAGIGESILVPTKTTHLHQANRHVHHDAYAKCYYNEPKKTVDLKYITSLDDLKSIKKQDPFMYYSIPGARKATVLMRDIDLSNLIGAGQAVQGETPQASQKVSRSTRISFECHPDLLLNDFHGLDSEDEEEPMNLNF